MAACICTPSIPQSLKSLAWAPYCLTTSGVEKKLTTIMDRLHADPSYHLNQEESYAMQLGLRKSVWPWGKEAARILKENPSQVLTAIRSLLSEAEDTSLLESASRYLEMLDEEELFRLSGIRKESAETMLRSEAHLNDEARKTLRAKGYGVVKEVLSEATHLFHHILDVFIAALGWNEVGGSAGRQNPFMPMGMSMSSMEAKAKLEFYLMVLTYPSLIFASAFAIAGSIPTALIATALITSATLAAIPIYIRFFKPCPKEHIGLENLVQKAMRGEHPPLFKRRDVLRKMQDAFNAGNGVLLTAPPGVGKTSAVQALADLIFSQECEPFLRQAQLFSGNANQLKEHWPNMLETLKQNFTRHEKEVVLFFDEIASSFQKSVVGTLPVDSLLTFKDKFPYIICATTTEQYNEYIKNHESFNRRFVHIELEPLSEEELKTVLYTFIHYKEPELTVEKEAIQKILNSAKNYRNNTSQVDAALSLLSSAIAKINSLSSSTLTRDIDQLQEQIDQRKLEIEHETTWQSDSSSLDTLVQEIERKKQELHLQQKQLQEIQKLEKLRSLFKQKSYELAARSQRKKWAVNQLLQQQILSAARIQRSKLGLPTGITSQLIEQVLPQVAEH